MPYKDPKELEKRKRFLYLDPEIHNEILAESKRQGRPISWLAQKAWTIAKFEIERFPVNQDYEDMRTRKRRKDKYREWFDNKKK